MTPTPSPSPNAALVTGGAVRLGRAIALALAGAGYDIALHYHSSVDSAETTAADIRALGVQVALFQADLGKASAAQPLVEAVHARFPAFNTLVNSASVYKSAPIRETSAELFDQQFAVNLRAPFFLTQAFANTCGAGNVINILDNKIDFNQFHYAAYLLSKKTLVELTKMAALELAPAIRVNGVAPGVVLPATSRKQAYIDWRVQGIPLKRHGSPDDITATILHILRTHFITGQIFVVDGGESITNSGLNSTIYTPGADKV